MSANNPAAPGGECGLVGNVRSSPWLDLLGMGQGEKEKHSGQRKQQEQSLRGKENGELKESKRAGEAGAQGAGADGMRRHTLGVSRENSWKIATHAKQANDIDRCVF